MRPWDMRKPENSIIDFIIFLSVYFCLVSQYPIYKYNTPLFIKYFCLLLGTTNCNYIFSDIELSSVHSIGMSG